MIKLSGICAVLLMLGITGHSQPRDHVRWAYSLQKDKEGVYEIHLKAYMDGGWHIYSQVQPDNSISIPCSFAFHLDSADRLEGKVREVGKLIRFFDPRAGLGANEYVDSVEFVQAVVFGSRGGGEITGELTYQACSDVICLPPKKIVFCVK